MTVEEIIENLKYLASDDCTDTQADYREELETAIKLLEKQIPMRIDEKTLIRNDNYNDGTNIPRYDWFCPRCNLETISTKFKYCPCCGQALDWSEIK